jgi:Zn finger protein HypA/HybF involved in hydrogenase expression
MSPVKSQLSFASRNKENRSIIKGTIKESFNFREIHKISLEWTAMIRIGTKEVPFYCPYGRKGYSKDPLNERCFRCHNAKNHIQCFILLAILYNIGIDI